MREPYLAEPAETIRIIQKYQFRFQKKFGQNFLIDKRVLEKIVRAADITKDDFVLEIGPGIGTLTQYLAYCAREVTAVEIDRNLLPILEETLADYPNVSVLNQDILKTDILAVAQEKNGGRPIKIVANLPYYITTPIIMELLQKHVPIESMTVMVQSEIGVRMQAKPGTKDYGALSLAVQYYAEPYLAANVPQNCFMPRPKVDSAVIRLKKHEKPPIKVQDEALLFRLVRASFNQRRKTLINGLANGASLPLSKDQLANMFADVGIDASARGETLSLEQFGALANRLSAAGIT